VYGEENGVLLLSQAFDDTASVSDFRPPDGTSLLGWTRSEDEVSLFVGIMMHYHRAETLN
jgi:hypothetical protein